MPPAARADSVRWVGEAWRATALAAVTSTPRLVDTAEEARLLDAMIDRARIARAEVDPLHDLLARPFRDPPRDVGSRFRGPADPGVWYGAVAVDTALAECGYWRWRFARAATLVIPPTPQQVFTARVDGRALRLDVPPLARRRRDWEHPSDYAATQRLARAARGDGIEILVNRSVRDPGRRPTVSVLAPSAFASPRPTNIEAWLLDVRTEGVLWQRTTGSGGGTVRFDFD
jgi:hypothetical protein